jgi:hypothetical protein
MGMIGEEASKDKYKLRIESNALDGNKINMVCRLLKVDD